MALVPYCAAPLGVANLAALKAMPERHYRVGEHFLTVEQHWAPDGRGGTALGFGGAFSRAFSNRRALSLSKPPPRVRLRSPRSQARASTRRSCSPTT